MSQLIPHIKCPWCDHKSQNIGRYRKHGLWAHPDKHQYDLELYIVRSRNPNLDIDLLITRYLEKKETILGLQKQGIYVKHFLRNIGVMRHPREDSGIGGAKTWNEASQEERFAGYLKADLTRLRNAGVTDLDEVMTALKLIKYAQKQLAKAKEPPKPEEPEERLYS